MLVKDNIATGDQMHTTAGAYVLKDWRADRDAFLVQQLRAAGAIILGKTNLSEWANWMDPCMPNGFSVLGGRRAIPTALSIRWVPAPAPPSPWQPISPR